MRKHIQNIIIDMIDTLLDGINTIQNQNNKLLSGNILNTCFESIKAIDNTLYSSLLREKYDEYKNLIDKICVLLGEITHHVVNDGNILNEVNEINAYLFKFSEKIKVESEVKLEILFMPYKRAMWDCLDSIWRNANDDERCNVSVVPIPYFDRDKNGQLYNYYYEGNEFSDYIPIIDFNSYDIKKHRPDIAYIHYPYDQYNRVTSISPDYYTSVIKKYVGKLIYVPYFISSCYNDYESIAAFSVPVILPNIDYIIYQSPIQLDVLKQSGKYRNNAFVLGNPKLDYYANLSNDEIHNLEFENKIGNSKCILLTSTLSIFLAQTISGNCYSSKWFELTKKIVDNILTFKNIVLIWRPHPLIKQTVISMRWEIADMYNKLVEYISQQKNCIIDVNPESKYAMYYSDGMISDGGSMTMQYMVTGKPLLDIYFIENKRYVTFDSSGCYSSFNLVYPKMNADEFRGLSESDRLETYMEGVLKFCELIISDTDPNKKDRIERMKKSVVNSDGTAGKKIHEKIMEIVYNSR